MIRFRRPSLPMVEGSAFSIGKLQREGKRAFGKYMEKSMFTLSFVPSPLQFVKFYPWFEVVRVPAVCRKSTDDASSVSDEMWMKADLFFAVWKWEKEKSESSRFERKITCATRSVCCLLLIKVKMMWIESNQVQYTIRDGLEWSGGGKREWMEYNFFSFLNK